MNKRVFIKDRGEDAKLLERAGSVAVSRAVRHAKALELTISYIKDGAVYEERPDGTVIFKKTVEKKATPFKLIKGMLLHAK